MDSSLVQDSYDFLNSHFDNGYKNVFRGESYLRFRVLTIAYTTNPQDPQYISLNLGEFILKLLRTYPDIFNFNSDVSVIVEIKNIPMFESFTKHIKKRSHMIIILRHILHKYILNCLTLHTLHTMCNLIDDLENNVRCEIELIKEQLAIIGPIFQYNQEEINEACITVIGRMCDDVENRFNIEEKLDEVVCYLNHSDIKPAKN